MLLDLRSERGYAAFKNRAARADVVTLNATHAQRDKLGLCASELHAINPQPTLVQLVLRRLALRMREALSDRVHRQRCARDRAKRCVRQRSLIRFVTGKAEALEAALQ